MVSRSTPACRTWGSERRDQPRELQPGETELAIDLRPATGQIYLLGSTSRLSVLDPPDGTGVNRRGAFTPEVSGTAFASGSTRDPHRIRMVSDTGQNLRVDPDTGAGHRRHAAHPGTPRIAGSAYKNNHAGATAATLYGIEPRRTARAIDPPNGGTMTPVGALGVDTTDDVGSTSPPTTGSRSPRCERRRSRLCRSTCRPGPRPRSTP